MKRRITKILAVFIALVVLLSTSSFTVDMHYCGDFLVDTGVFSKAEACSMETLEEPSSSNVVFKKSCCSNKQLVIDGQEELRLNNFEFNNEKQQLFAFVASYVNRFKTTKKSSTYYKDYSPPNLVENIRVLNQVFII